MVGLLKKSGLAVLFLLGLLACDKSALDGERAAGQGSLTARLHTTPGASKAAQVELEVPPVENFTVTIRSVTEQVVYTSLCSELPYSLNLTEGNYTIEANQGQNLPFVTENPYYFIQKSFKIARGETTSVELTARLFGFGIEGFFDADMVDHFASWQLEAEIDNVWDESYRWAEQGNKPRAYFLPGTVRVILRGVRHNGEPFSKVIKKIHSTGHELYTLRIHILPAGHALKITTDTERRLVTDQGVVSIDALPDLEAPTLGGMTFYETTTVPLDGLEATAELHSLIGFAQVEVIAPKAGYGLEARGYRWSDAADRAALRAAGVDLGADDLSQSRTATLNAKGLVNNMLADAAVEREYDLAVAITDSTGKATSATLPIRIERPEFTLPAIEAAACWTKRVEVPDVTIIDGKGDMAGVERHGDFSYQISSDGGATWSDFSRTELAAVGLTPNTEYHFRTRFRDLIGTAVAAKTESVVQIPNGNMEDWWIDSYKSYHHYKPWKQGANEVWNTSNPRCFTYSGVTTQYNSPTSVLYTPVAHSGSRAAELRSVRITVTGRENVVAKLVLGTLTSGSANASMSGSNNPEYLTEGRPFTSRPTHVGYWYKYAPYGADEHVVTIRLRNGDAVIAQAEVRGSAAVSAYTYQQVELTYLRTDLPATSLYICFAASKDSKFDSRVLSVQYYDGWSSNWSADAGSFFNVDDIELIYDK